MGLDGCGCKVRPSDHLDAADMTPMFVKSLAKPPALFSTTIRTRSCKSLDCSVRFSPGVRSGIVLSPHNFVNSEPAYTGEAPCGDFGSQFDRLCNAKQTTRPRRE